MKETMNILMTNFRKTRLKYENTYITDRKQAVR